MADPRIAGAFEMTAAGPRPRSANLSPLMQARARASQGEKHSFCPFGCGVGQLDENWYCHHLVGFSDDGKEYEPLLRKRGRRVVQVHREQVETGEVEEVEVRVRDAKTGEITTHVEQRPVYEYGPAQREKVLPTDKLVQITTSFRVYRDVAAPGKPGDKKKAG
jgi:hypothetical protein